MQSLRGGARLARPTRSERGDRRVLEDGYAPQVVDERLDLARLLTREDERTLAGIVRSYTRAAPCERA